MGQALTNLEPRNDQSLGENFQECPKFGLSGPRKGWKSTSSSLFQAWTGIATGFEALKIDATWTTARVASSPSSITSAFSFLCFKNLSILWSHSQLTSNAFSEAETFKKAFVELIWPESRIWMFWFYASWFPSVSILFQSREMKLELRLKVGLLESRGKLETLYKYLKLLFSFLILHCT